MRPGCGAVPASISRMPLAMAFRDRPHARLTSDIPPRPKARASLAAISRRVRSSNSDHTAASLARSPEEASMPHQHMHPGTSLQPLLFYDALAAHLM
jgi:hypothetical protein